MERMTAFIGLGRRLRSEGSDMEEVLCRLRIEGATIIESLKVIREIEAIPLGKAKEIVDASVTWADRYGDNDALRTTAIEALENDIEARRV
jgi:ribosomal protein L7/L12